MNEYPNLDKLVDDPLKGWATERILPK